MQERARADVSDGVSWSCPQCYTRKSIHDGNLFAKLKIPAKVDASAPFLCTSATDAMQEAEVDRRTTIDAYQWFREICSSNLVQAPQSPGVVVHIDESLFRRKPKVQNT